MKKLFALALMFMCLGSLAQNSTTFTHKAKYICSPPDKIFFIVSINNVTNDTFVLVQLELDSKSKSTGQDVILYLGDQAIPINNAIVEVDSKKYVATYNYVATFFLDSALSKKIIDGTITGYVVAGQKENVSKGRKYSYALVNLLRETNSRFKP